MLATRKMKKTTVWTLWRRSRLARRRGRIVSMAAPVVPIQEARKAPQRRVAVFPPGVPRRVPRIRMPPETVKRAQRTSRKGAYSVSRTVASSCRASRGNPAPKGTRKREPQKSTALSKWWCQKEGARRGRIAMESSSPRKGRPDQRGSLSPRGSSGETWLPGAIAEGSRRAISNMRRTSCVLNSLILF